MLKRLFLLWIACPLLIAAPASLTAQTVVLSIDFGGFEPQQINMLFTDIATENFDKTKVIPRDQQIALLNSRFPEIVIEDVSENERKFGLANQAYIKGDFEKAMKLFDQSLDEASDNLTIMNLRMGFSDTVFQGAVALGQIYSFVSPDEIKLDSVIKRMVRLFPLRRPSESDFGGDFFEKYDKIKPDEQTGYKITINVDTACKARVNGYEIDPFQAKQGFYVFGGDYSVSKVCEGRTVRAYVIPVKKNMDIDFEGGFAKAFTYPISFALSANSKKIGLDTLTEYLIEIGERLKIDHIVGIGLVVSESDKLRRGYTAILVNVKEGKIERIRQAPPAEVSTKEGMEDFINSLWTGNPYRIVKVEYEARPWLVSGIVLTSFGGASLIAAAALSVMTKKGYDEFKEINKSYPNRVNGKDGKHINKVQQYRLPADILYGVGGGLTALGISFILVDALRKDNDEEMAFGNGRFDIMPTYDGMSAAFTYRW